MNRVYCLFSLLFFILSCGLLVAKQGGEMRLTSPEFKHNSSIPKKFTCQDSDINPELIIENIPQGTKSLVLIMDDPDAPVGLWVHWVVYNIPIIGKINENSIPGTEGLNTLKQKSYHGPCPPSGTHRYFFKIYALDTELKFESLPNKQALENAMQGHILESAELIGLYKKL